jgi:hypothetical protein
MIKYLVSTSETQGYRENDFCFVPENEILRFGFECDNEEVDGWCGCKRSLVGIKCKKSTTTMKVAELNITVEDLVQRISFSLDSSGWDFTKPEDKEVIKEEVQEIIRLCSNFPTGAILERRGNVFRRRK